MNTRVPTLIAACLAVASMVVVVKVWRDLKAQRELTADLRVQLENAAIAPGVAAPVRPPADIAQQGPAPTASGTSNPEPTPAAMSPRPLAALKPMSERELLKDAEYRKARRAVQRANLVLGYPGLAEELGLSRPELDQLFDVLVDNQLELAAQERPPTPAEAQESNRSRQALSLKQDEAVRALLGDARHALWLDYQRAAPARNQAGNYAMMLAQAGAPLTSNQLRSMTTTLLSDRNAMQDMAQLTRGPVMDVRSRQQAQQAREAESHRRILEATTAYLTPQQQAALRGQFQYQEASALASARMQEIAAAIRARP